MVNLTAGSQSLSISPPRSLQFEGKVHAMLLVIAVFFVPMKGFAIELASQSIYLPYLGLMLGIAVVLPRLSAIFFEHFANPMLVVILFSLFYFWQTNFQPSVFVFGAKIFVTLAMTALYVYLLKTDERAVIKYLYAGAVISIVYMIYQGISVAIFSASLPFTAINYFDIGRGLGGRYGFVRTTGFTEEPSYIAVMLLGTALMLRSFGKRSGESQRKRYLVLSVGLLLCTSNSLFATIPLILIFGLFYRLGIPFLFFVVYYLVNIVVEPYVLNLDQTFFARFSSYSQFRQLPPANWWFGIGFNQYASLPFPEYFDPTNLDEPTVITGIASLWGGVLLEGGIVFAAVFCAYLSRITQKAKDATGFALMAVLIMLANYYSPWWPIVSLVLAYTIVSRDKFVSSAPLETLA